MAVPWFKTAFTPTLSGITMQIKQIALAVAAALAAASSFAADVPHVATSSYTTGASAQQPDFTAALGTMCTAAGGTLHAFKATANNNGGLENQLTLACQDSTGAAKSFNLTAIDTVYQNVGGGSLTSVINPLLNTSTTFVDPASATCAVGITVGSGAVLPAGTVVHTGCGTLTSQSEGGFSDTEVTIAQSYLDGVFAASGISPTPSLATITTKSANLLQAFGVAVSDDLYVALYKAQVGTIIPASLCPAATATAADIVAAGYGSATVTANTLCQPSVSRAEMASIMNGTTIVKNNGTLVFNGLASNKLTYCRRPVTSGTQQTAQNYFLTNPASTSGLPVIGGDYTLLNSASKIESISNGVKFAVFVGSGTGNTTDCLGGRNADTTPGANGTIAAGPVYRIGIVSAEKRPNVAFASSTTAAQGNYKFVRLSEVPVTEGGTTSTNTFTAKTGRYDFIVESRVNTETAATSAATVTLLDQVIANISGNAYPGLFKIDTTATTTRSFNHFNSDSKAPVVR
jgi:hypothetical protein